MNNDLGLRLVAVFLLVCVVAVISGLVGVKAEDQPQNWAALLRRIQSSQNAIEIELRFRAGTGSEKYIAGSLTDLGFDYLCVAKDGYTSCAQFDNIARIITPPGTFGKTESGR